MHLFYPGIAFITITGLPMNFTIEIEQEEDGRFLAEVIGFPGVLAYGQTPEEAVARVQALALRVLADKLEHGEVTPELVSVSFVAA
ncbi:type II toxin-antitoxin system HicB family antitoxin [Nostoc sp. FACHB-892]|uniref:type II toxin-antitoxin system HicB family antitoxin n=1 Tax=Nostoc sp. FACHB-892 TaxID=2692843 RepID=UPI001F558FB8|nr:type II toxin-antitoxin system HicB family antitoxin [Nostoc sp. FACHB-892]